MAAAAELIRRAAGIYDHQVGLETMCVAGGQGEAMIVERV